MTPSIEMMESVPLPPVMAAALRSATSGPVASAKLAVSKSRAAVQRVVAQAALQNIVAVAAAQRINAQATPNTTGTRRLGCTPGVATPDPVHVARFSGQSRNITTYLRQVAGEIRQLMARRGIRRLADVIGRRDLLEKKPDLAGEAALADVGHLVDRASAAGARAAPPPPDADAPCPRRACARRRRPSGPWKERWWR